MYNIVKFKKIIYGVKNMGKYNIYKSIIDKNIKKEFKDSDWCSSLMY